MGFIFLELLLFLWMELRKKRGRDYIWSKDDLALLIILPIINLKKITFLYRKRLRPSIFLDCQLLLGRTKIHVQCLKTEDD